MRGLSVQEEGSRKEDGSELMPEASVSNLWGTTDFPLCGEL